MDNDHATHRPKIKFFDIVRPHVALTCLPGFEWIILCENCLADRVPFWSNFKSRDSLSALEPSKPGPMYVRTFRVLPFRSASVKSRFEIFVVSEDILNSYFQSPGLYRDTVISSCLRGSPSTTCSSGLPEERVFGTSSDDVCHAKFSARHLEVRTKLYL